MRVFIISLTLAMVFWSNASAARPPRGYPNFEALCSRHRVTGCFMVHHVARDHTMIWNPPRCRQGFLPASSFKIYNTCIGMETGVLQGPEHCYHWDGTKRSVRAWNRDHTLRTAFANSVVPYYQQLAREIGLQRMQQYIDRLPYGNRDISAGIDCFWLEGPMRITPEQQLELLVRLLAGKTMFSEHTIETLKSIAVIQRTNEYVLSGKTGWARYSDRNVGWLIGWVDTDRNRYVYVTNVESPRASMTFAAARMKITMAMLRGLRMLGNER